MRNLKRALSLALAAIMLVGMMVIGASAVDYSDFTDSGDIVNQDAVTMLTTLGVIDGKPDGSYAPTELVTRDQMAKMISVILNQGADVNDVYANLDSGLTDISSNWAKGHINYCYTLGVIAGRGDGTFDPGANVTAAEAAKMLLVAAGYDPATEGFVGAQWSWNVNAKASSLGIYKNYTKGVLEPLNRDDAALLIYNALDIERIERYENGYARVYADNRTILSSLYGVYKIVGIVTGNEWARLEGSGVDDALAKGKTRVASLKVLASDTQQTNIFGGNTPNEYQFNVSTDLDMLGKAVTMFIRKETILNNIEVLGVVYNNELNTVVTVDSNKTKETDALKDSGLSTRVGTTQYYVNYGYVADAAAAQARLGISRANSNGIVMECIDNNDDGIVDYVLYLKEDLAVVSSVSKDGDKIVLRGVNDNDSIATEDMVTDMTFELDDVVLVVTFGGRFYVSEPQIVSGEMNSYTAKKDEEEAIEVDGVDYKPSAIGKLDQTVTSANGVGDIIDLDVKKCEEATGVNFEITYDFFLDSHGYMRAFRPTSQSLPSYALVLNSGYDPGVYSSEASGKLTVLLADGSEGTYPINFTTSAANLAKQLYAEDQRAITVDGTYNVSKTDRGVIELKGFLGTDYTDNSPTRPWRFQNNDTNASAFQFAYKDNTPENNNTTGLDVNTTDYKAGQAAGYVIQYTLSESGVMTIKYVMGTVANGYSVNRNLTTNTQLTAAPVHTLSTMQNTLYTAYGSGSARVYHAAGQAVAVDKNTVAFYYDEIDNDSELRNKYADRTDLKIGDVLYGVAVGYDNMADVQKGASFMASTVVRTTYNTTTEKYEYDSTNLADVILFDEANILTARDYAFVLSANRRDVNSVTLNVLFEDGTAGTLVVTRSNFDNIIGDEKENFLRPYAYTIGADDKATIYKGDPVGEGFVFRLKKETVAMDNVQRFWAYDINNVKIWDVTDASAGDDGVKLSDFAYQNSGINYKGYLILNTDGTVRTAFVWETDDKNVSIDTGHSHNWDSYMTLADGYEVGYGNTTSEIVAAFRKDHDVEMLSDVDLSGKSFQIPKGRTVKINGDLDLKSAKVSGDGVLWVTGDVVTSTSTSISGVTVIIEGKLTVSNNISIGSLMYVGGDVEIENGKELTIASTGDVHVNGNLAGDTSNTVIVDKTDGHLEVEGNFDAGIIRVYSVNTLIVRGVLRATTLEIGKGTDAGRVITYDQATVGTVTIAANSELVHNGTESQRFFITTKLDTEAKSKLTGGYIDVTGATSTIEIGGTIDIDTLNFTGKTVTLEETATGTIDNIVPGTGGKIKAEAGSTVEIKDTKNATPLDTELSGTIDGDVTASDNVAVEEKAEAEIGGNVTIGSGKKITVNGTLTLKGGTSSTSAGTIEVGSTGKLVVSNGESTTSLDVSKIDAPAAPEDANTTTSAEISFAADAQLTGEPSNFFEVKEENGEKVLVQIEDAAQLKGRTFKADDKNNYTPAARETTPEYVWVATDTKSEVQSNIATLGDNAVSVSGGDYKVSQDTAVITLTGSLGDDEKITVTFKLASNQTIGLESNVTGVTNKGNGVFEVDKTFTGESFKVILEETSKTKNEYTVKFAAPTT